MIGLRYPITQINDSYMTYINNSYIIALVYNILIFAIASLLSFITGSYIPYILAILLTLVITFVLKFHIEPELHKLNELTTTALKNMSAGRVNIDQIILTTNNNTPIGPIKSLFDKLDQVITNSIIINICFIFIYFAVIFIKSSSITVRTNNVNRTMGGGRKRR